jgi:hypothetical protein
MCNIIGHCWYCKEEVTDDDDHVTFKKATYHVTCYDLMKEELNAE